MASAKTPKLAVATAANPSAAKAEVAKHAAPEAGTKPIKPKGDRKPRETNDARVITVVAKENPRREGTKAHLTFSLYKTGLTVSAWRALCAANGGDPGYLLPDEKAGFIKLA